MSNIRKMVKTVRIFYDLRLNQTRQAMNRLMAGNTMMTAISSLDLSALVIVIF